jgi:hypothetical protein
MPGHFRSNAWPPIAAAIRLCIVRQDCSVAFRMRFAATPITNPGYMLDTFNACGGTHHAYRGMFAVQLRGAYLTEEI